VRARQQVLCGWTSLGDGPALPRRNSLQSCPVGGGVGQGGVGRSRAWAPLGLAMPLGPGWVWRACPGPLPLWKEGQE
jgi:hypothetical protein